ncbi:MAG: sulfatase-like hydrolase/transferase, partial [Armatimonadota bacterium]|nr:sulfatase-like hydrolase/transferase [Armatimonadota bacterium]
LHTSFALSACLLAPALTSGGVAAEPVQRPNIVVILADDMGYSDIGCYGGDIETPNLDKLANAGLRFTRFYNAARCCPTRASLMTGLYPHQAGIGDMNYDLGLEAYRGELNRHCVTIAEVLKGAGYATYMTGKWHLTQFRHNSAGSDAEKANWPRQRGFDRYYGIIAGAANYFHPETLTLDNERLPPPGDNYYTTDAFSDYAVQVINEHDKSKPFFFYVAYNAPHWPLNAKPQDIAKYKGRFDKGWDALRKARHQRMIKMGLVDSKWELSPAATEWSAATNKQQLLHKMETYAAMVDSMDQGIGRIVETLKTNGTYDNTLLIFLSDNGACHEAASYGVPWANLSNTPYRRYKHWTHEGGIATPLIVHWPARIKTHGEWRQQPGHVMDLMATCVDVAGATYPAEYTGEKIQPMEGKSLVPAFDNQPIQRDAIYWEHEGNRAVLAGDWKLVSAGNRRQNAKWELYNMASDRTETHDLIAAESERARQLARMWETWAERVHVKPFPTGKATQEEDEGATTGAKTSVPTPQIANKALTITCDVTPQSRDGVILAQGGAQRGYAVHLKDGKPIFSVRQNGQLYAVIASAAPEGKFSLEAHLEKDGAMTLAINGTIVARGKAPGLIKLQPTDELSIGADVRGAVGDYTAPHPLQGEVENVKITTQ